MALSHELVSRPGWSRPSETTYTIDMTPRGIEHQDEPLHGRPLAVDRDAATSNPELPGFLARPPGAPVYHGFPILEDVEVDGFKLGMISDWESDPTMRDGDAFVVAPDNSRCGLNWYISDEPIFREVLAMQRSRWGVWDVGFPYELTSRESARLNLQVILPRLKEVWSAWREQFAP